MLNAKQRQNLEKMSMKSKMRRPTGTGAGLSPFAGGKAPGAPMSPQDMAQKGMAMPGLKKGGRVKGKK